MALTEDKINAVIAALAADKVAAGAAKASAATITHISLLIDHLTTGLEAALADAEPTWNGWVRGMAPLFRELAVELETVLAGPAGACRYNGDCIFTSKEVCDGLGGTFYAHAPC